ncbi:polysaccharide deacetylase family protein [Alkalicoccus urumqiensis]|nr:polysaccharide deacetylase family protein [Alkalicoccus urumqiensis]
MLSAVILAAGCSADNEGAAEAENNVHTNTETAPDENNSAAEELNETNDAEDNSEEEELEIEDEEENEEGKDEEESDGEEDMEEPETPAYSLQGDSSIAPLEEGAENNAVLLTIDDAPDQHAVEMAETLAELDAGAIFFVNGHFLEGEEKEEMLQHIHELGFEIGNHTMTHPNLRDVTEGETEEEIIALNDRIEEIIGERPRFFRAPFGVNTDKSEEVVETEGMQSMNWTYGYDFEADYMEAEALEEIMVETELLRGGANLLMHDRSFTLEALPGIVEGLREKGYEIVDVRDIE